MKTPLLLAAFCLLTGNLLHANPLQLLPAAKVPVIVPEDERNPFSVRATPTAQVVPTDTESEESRLRGLLGGMKVTGFSEGEGGVSVLLGGYLLRPGELIPPLLRRQTERIQVAAIRPGQIELLFLESGDRPATRRLTLEFSTQPFVRYLLGTQVSRPAANTILEGRYPDQNNPGNEPAPSGP